MVRHFEIIIYVIFHVIYKLLIAPLEYKMAVAKTSLVRHLKQVPYTQNFTFNSINDMKS